MDIYQATGISAQRLELDIQTDQVDSIRALHLPDGSSVKYIEWQDRSYYLEHNLLCSK